jgi:hypothetical protein
MDSFHLALARMRALGDRSAEAREIVELAGALLPLLPLASQAIVELDAAGENVPASWRDRGAAAVIALEKFVRG